MCLSPPPPPLPLPLSHTPVDLMRGTGLRDDDAWWTLHTHTHTHMHTHTRTHMET